MPDPSLPVQITPEHIAYGAGAWATIKYIGPLIKWFGSRWVKEKDDNDITLKAAIEKLSEKLDNRMDALAKEMRDGLGANTKDIARLQVEVGHAMKLIEVQRRSLHWYRNCLMVIVSATKIKLPKEDLEVVELFPVGDEG